MRQEQFTLSAIRPLADGIYEMNLEGDTGSLHSPGQFVNIRIPGLFLRRPISVCDYDSGVLTLIVRVAGKGTDILTGLPVGSRLDLLCGLGNGFDVSKSGTNPLLIGGGVGCAPLFGLCRRLRDAGRTVDILMGFNRAEEIFYVDEFEALGATVHIATADGSLGTKGFVTALIPRFSPTYFYACGPEPMYRAMHTHLNAKGQYSYEARMGCGFGACVGCSMETADGVRRVCKDGPVFESEALLWNN